VAEQTPGAEEFTLTPEGLEARNFALAMAKVASDVKVQDLSVLHVEPLVSWTSYMVICSVFSKPQLLAVVARMEDAALQDWDRTKQNNVGSSPWEVIDFGDVVVHVFTPEQREYYDIESFYAAAEELDLPFEAQEQQQQQQGLPPSVGTSGWRKG
jgi:ribosome silencing factor RsfS/YbeB/iojap